MTPEEFHLKGAAWKSKLLAELSKYLAKLRFAQSLAIYQSAAVV